jgi:hypothetical protein
MEARATATGTIVRIHLGGSWSAPNFEEFFQDLQILYLLALGLRRRKYGLSEDLHDLSLGEEPRLAVAALEYGSSGYCDITGIGVAVGHIKDFLIRLVELWTERERRRLEEEKLGVSIQRMRIENAQQFVQLVIDARKAALPEPEKKELVQLVHGVQADIWAALDEGRITDVEDASPL